jgi:hypothetical protein
MRVRTFIALFALTQGIISPRIARRTDRSVARVPPAYISISERLDDRLEIAQQFSNRCFTPYFWCYLPGTAPINTPCWCASPNGPVAGVVR